MRRIDHRPTSPDTICECGAPMQRVGEDVSERLDVIPAEFIVHRHVHGKWACRCCQPLVQEPVAPQVVDKGQPTAAWWRTRWSRASWTTCPTLAQMQRITRV